MNRRVITTLAMAAGILLTSVSSLAHHCRALIYESYNESSVIVTFTEFV